MLVTRIAKFGAVGVLNTVIDFTIYNLLTSKRFKLSRVRANLISTSIAMIFSFFANQRYVFQSQGGSFWVQALSFYAVTAFGLYVLQNLVIHFLSKNWKLIPNLAVKIVHILHLNRLLSDDFVSKNTVKLAATLISLIWNFVLFQYVVFR